MANEYIANASDLTSVARAIRDKGKTSKPLVFPSGFVSAIEGIKGGLELNFHVIGGSVQPSNPEENTIFINTSTPITKCILSEEEPANAEEGMVWLETGTNGFFNFNALKENSIEISVVSVSLYDGTSWVTQSDATFYQNGVWNKRILRLYNYGDECIGVTGGYTAYAKGLYNGSNNPNMPTITRYDDYIEARQTKSAASGILATNNKISFAGMKTMYVRGSASSTGNCYVCSWPELGEYAGPGHFVGRINLSTSESIKTVDVSKLQGEYYVGCLVYTSGTWLRIKELWLE